jgi:hypothetical protein
MKKSLPKMPTTPKAPAGGKNTGGFQFQPGKGTPKAPAPSKGKNSIEKSTRTGGPK